MQRAENQFSTDALAALNALPWRGTARQMRNAVERLIVLCPNDRIEATDVHRYVGVGSGSDAVASLVDRYDSIAAFRDAAEKAFLERKLAEMDWIVSRTADLIDLQRANLYNKMRRYGIERPD